jgi:glycosyltransferase involved in cell wall biosynthesis
MTKSWPPGDILIVHSSIQPPGGGNGVCAWMIQALARDYAVDVLTWEPVELDAVNRYFGTSLRVSDFREIRVSRGLRAVVDSMPGSLGLLQTSILLRRCRRIGHDYRAILSANNEGVFGRPGIQYVHCPWAFRRHPEQMVSWYHGSETLMNAYISFCVSLCGYSDGAMKRNLTLVNSEWTRARVRECYGIESTVLYPPVTGSYPPAPWCEREDGFVCVGRFASEKRIKETIAIVKAVREAGVPARLHVVGTRIDSHYYESILRLVRKNAEWVTLHENLTREELARLMASRKYGIHGMLEEHFGMAIAEMVDAGCIVFVPRGGGQVEIVGSDERLTYRDAGDAVAKILRVMSSEAEQQALRAHLESRRGLYSVETFKRRLREIVGEFAERRESPDARASLPSVP